ncbi:MULTISPECIES: lysophospholipid acyltransferase family protein [Thioclava]|uniref:Lauroyl acyltransferase n=1 Tax=Thioclava nitratireducens TaxID=1915078 RepID=A0ABN4XBV2_9RHOB|nr:MULTISPECIES: lysophospholipid acyltransferase family protein [Thioclava]AQS47617.1 lauroyl acyltransferase [Thioclava nitratireducens]OWY04138.1 lauroyl acyltransferase [Thioclava sp. IC9]OWY05648.1 lauroyl acyltransferase [Thioclava sp. F1Mire-8]OWY10944.1 lauroyl acyltransferase [Thioclava sp. F42-5]PWE51259.1 lauroyl acyltransferase [Thioclava sp. NG1]
MKYREPTLSDRVSNALFVAVMRLVQRLPYERRIPAAGRMVARLAPVLGFTRKIRENLAIACPDLSEDEIKRLQREMPDNLGRMLAEIYSGEEFVARVRDLPIEGPGAETLEAAHREGRPVVLAAGHFGNYDAWRAALAGRGYRVGAIYRPMNNPLFNEQYVSTISAIAEPLFSRSRRGLGDMIKFLRDGGMVAFGFDQHFSKGAELSFFGLPAFTPLSAAEMALKMKADLVPIYAIRQPDGLSFRIYADKPVPHTDPETMTQTLNDGLEEMILKHMEQWLWIHRRWKGKRK